MEIKTILATDIRSTRNKQYLSMVVLTGMYNKTILLLDLISIEYRNEVFIVRYIET